MTASKFTGQNSESLLAGLASSFDHAPWAVIELSGEVYTVRYANSAFCRLMGKARDEVIGSPFKRLLPSAGECLTLLDRVFRTGVAASYTTTERAVPFPILYSYTLWPVMADDRTAGVMIQVNETGPLHETRQAISQALLLGALRQDELLETADSANIELQIDISQRRQREEDAKLLANELAHRVKNNLAVVAALISTEMRRTPEPWVQGYRALQNRVMAISQLYDMMSESNRHRTVDLDVYLTGIAKSLSTSLLEGTAGIRIAVETEAMEINSERAVPFGLLVNELSTNAVKYAFPHGMGLITLALRRIGSEIELTVADDGIGITAKRQEGTPGKHGSDYMAIFVRQLQGVMVRSTEPGAGTTISIRFPAAPDL